MAKERVVYQSLLESLFTRALAGQMTPKLREALRREGLDVDALPTSLPVSVYLRCIECTAATLYPDRSLYEGMRELGRLLSLSVWRTAVGKAMVGCLRLLGPRRAMEWLTRLFRAVDSHSEVRAIREGPTCYRVTTNSPDAPEGYAEAILEEVLRVAGGRHPRVKTLETTATTATYRASWET